MDHTHQAPLPAEQPEEEEEEPTWEVVPFPIALPDFQAWIEAQPPTRRFSYALLTYLQEVKGEYWEFNGVDSFLRGREEFVRAAAPNWAIGLMMDVEATSRFSDDPNATFSAYRYKWALRSLVAQEARRHV